MSIKYKHVEEYTPPFRATFINAVSPNTYGDKPKYDIRSLWPNLGNDNYSNLDWFYDTLNKCAQINNLLNADGSHQCEGPNFLDGNGPKCFTKETKEQYEGHLNHWYLGMRSSDNDGVPQPFGIVNMQNQPVEAKDLYPGIWLDACYRLVPYDHPKFGLKIIMRVDHLRVVGHDAPFTSVGGNISTSKVFENARVVTGLPAHVQATQGPGPNSAPQGNPAGPGPNTIPQARPGGPGPNSAPQLNRGPGATQAGPGPNAAPQARPAGPGPMAPTAADHVAGFSNDAPVIPAMGPNSQGFTYQQWIDTGRDDDQLRREGVIT